MILDPEKVYGQLRALAEEGRMVCVVPALTEQGDPAVYCAWTARFTVLPDSAQHPSCRIRGAFYVGHAEMTHKQMEAVHGHS